MTGTVKRGVAFAVMAAVVVACSGSASPSPGNGAATATLKEWQITLSSSTFSAGLITFSLKNDGDKEHEFVIRKTDLQADSLPLNADSEVSEDAPELSEVGDPSEVEEVPAGSSDKSLAVTLAAGHYVVFCNIHVDELLHYQKGMHADFTVTG